MLVLRMATRTSSPRELSVLCLFFFPMRAKRFIGVLATHARVIIQSPSKRSRGYIQHKTPRNATNKINLTSKTFFACSVDILLASGPTSLTWEGWSDDPIAYVVTNVSSATGLRRGSCGNRHSGGSPASEYNWRMVNGSGGGAGEACGVDSRQGTQPISAHQPKNKLGRIPK